MKLQLTIETYDRKLGLQIAGVGDSLTAGTYIDAPSGAKVEYVGSLAAKSFGIPEVLQFVVDVAKDVDLGLLVTWLYEKVKGKNIARIAINRREVIEITYEGIRKTLEEEVKII